MTELAREFGDLLTQGLKSIAARESKALLALEDELGYEMGVTRYAIEKWRQGHVPLTPQTVAFLARACVRRGGMGRAWLFRFLTQARFSDKEALARELVPGEDEATPAVRHNLPRRPYERFIGREDELAEVRRFLSACHRAGVVCISGMGGVGKTALALEIAHHFFEEYDALPPDERFEAIVWVTAKQIELLPTGPTARHPTFTNLDDLYRALAEVLNILDIISEPHRETQGVIVARILVRHRVLLVLDNLEDIDDPALVVFLRDLPAPSKAIVTTRHRIDVAVPIHLQALNEAEARELVRTESQPHRLSLTDEQSEKLLRRTGGLPLAIVRTIGRMAWRGSSIETELLRLGEPTSDIYDFCFEPSIALIRNGDAHRLFMALSLFAIDAGRDVLGYVAGFEEDVLSRDEGLSDLEVLSLVTKDSNRFSLEPMTKVRAQAELAAHPNYKRETRERWIGWYKVLAGRLESQTDHPAFRSEAHNLLGAIGWLLEQGQMVDVGWFFCRIQRFLYAEGYWEPLTYLAHRVMTWAEDDGNTNVLAAILQTTLDTFRQQGAFTQGEKWLERAQNTAIRLNDELLQAEVWLAQGRLWYGQETFVEGARAVTKSLSVFDRYAKYERVVHALNTLGNLYLHQQRFEEAAGFYREGLQVLESFSNKIPRSRDWWATLQGNLGLAAGRQGHHAEACDILGEILNSLTLQTDLADAYAALALYEFRIGHVDQARLHREKADRIIENLGLNRPICEEDAEWMQLYSRQG